MGNSSLCLCLSFSPLHTQNRRTAAGWCFCHPEIINYIINLRITLIGTMDSCILSLCLSHTHNRESLLHADILKNNEWDDELRLITSICNEKTQIYVNVYASYFLQVKRLWPVTM